MALPRITIVGNVVADPELRFTPAGKGISRFRVASNENRKDDRGEWIDGPSCFLDVTCFAPLAEPVVEELRKGMPVVVIGRQQQREYEDRNGVKRTSYEVIAETVAMTVRPGKAPQRTQQVQDPWATGPGNQMQDDEPPF